MVSGGFDCFLLMRRDKIFVRVDLGIVYLVNNLFFLNKRCLKA
jgi:hypothetical protein